MPFWHFFNIAIWSTNGNIICHHLSPLDDESKNLKMNHDRNIMTIEWIPGWSGWHGKHLHGNAPIFTAHRDRINHWARTSWPPESMPPPALQLAHGRTHPLLQNGQGRALQSGRCSRCDRAHEDGVRCVSVNRLFFIVVFGVIPTTSILYLWTVAQSAEQTMRVISVR